MLSVQDKKSAKLEKSVAQAESELFSFAEYDPTAGERIGYSNYSYWGSTFRAFCKKKSAIFLTVVLVVMLIFTIVQPLLPGQYDANKVNTYPMTSMQIFSVSPTTDNVYVTVPAGTLLTCSTVRGYDDWYAVTNIVSTIPKRTDFTVTEYASDWCTVEYKGATGYIQTTDKLKLPDDPTQTPYKCKSNFNCTMHFSKVNYSNTDTNSGGWLYVEKSAVTMNDDGTAVTASEAELRIIPSTYGFLFGTNAIGQDLWARVWSGTRTSLYIGFMVAIVEACVGILVGVLWGYVRALDRILTEIYNVLDNIPTTIVLILIAYIMSPSVTTLIFAMCLTNWMGMARFIRNQIIIIRDRDYNLASRCLGASSTQIMMKNLLPYLVSVIMLRMALAIPGAIGSEVFITYIGLGIPIDTPSLGNLINEGRKVFASAPHLRYQLIFPTIVLSIITISFYIIGNSFADAADPKNHM